MLTRTTPSRANASPRYHGLALQPAMKPPPWIHTSTGKDAPRSGVKMLTLRQSSPGITGSGIPPMNVTGGCSAVGPYSRQSRTPSHGATGAGARKRRSPNGGAAAGTPRDRRLQRRRPVLEAVPDAIPRRDRGGRQEAPLPERRGRVGHAEVREDVTLLPAPHLPRIGPSDDIHSRASVLVTFRLSVESAAM